MIAIQARPRNLACSMGSQPHLKTIHDMAFGIGGAQPPIFGSCSFSPFIVWTIGNLVSFHTSLPKCLNDRLFDLPALKPALNCQSWSG